jgi:hypothetical protein
MLREGSAMASPTRKLVNGLAVVLTVLAVLVTFGTSAEAQRVTQIQARITTSNNPGAGTNAKMFLGIAGREFRLDSDNPSGDFELGQDVIYTLGVNANANFLRDPAGNTGMFNIVNAAGNDPQVDGLGVPVSEVLQLPIYIRMSEVSFDPDNPLHFPEDDWLVEDVSIVARTGPNGENFVAAGISPTLDLLRQCRAVGDCPGEAGALRLGSSTGFYLYFIRD